MKRKIRKYKPQELPIRRLPSAVICILLLLIPLTAQDKIDGYKVHRSDVKLLGDRDSRSGLKQYARVSFSNPRLVGVSLSGLRFAVDSSFTVHGQSGTVESLRFENVRVNGTDVEIDRYKHAIKFKKGRLNKPENPFVFTLGAVGTLKSALRELTGNNEVWRVTGRVYIFGRFRKLFAKHRRVVPLDFDIQVTPPK